MARIVIRDVDDAVVEALRTRAAKKRQSLEKYLRDLPTAAAKPSREEILAEIDRIRAMTPPRPKNAPSAVELIRQGREERTRQILKSLTRRA